MFSCVKQLSTYQHYSVIPRLSQIRTCFTRTNTPSYTPLLDIIKVRQDQARKSVLVQVAGPNSALGKLSKNKTS